MLLCIVPLFTYKTKQFLWAALKIFIVLVAGYFVYRKLITADFWVLENHFSNIDTTSLYLYITIMILLSVLNWGLEIKKWQILSSQVRTLTLKNTLGHVFIAHIFGFVTPAKAGDYGAKSLFFPKEDRKKVLFLNFLGNMYQLLATLFFGLIGLGIIAFFTSGSAIFFWLMAVMMCLLFYFIFPRFLNRIKWSIAGYNWAKVRSYFKTIKPTIKKNSKAISFIRYLVFAHQFYFVLWVLGSDLSYIFTMACIMSIYLITSVLPVMQLFDVVIKGGVGVIIFSWFGISEEIVLSAVLAMWILNTLLPLVVGSYFLLSRKRIYHPSHLLK